MGVTVVTKICNTVGASIEAFFVDYVAILRAIRNQSCFIINKYFLNT